MSGSFRGIEELHINILGFFLQGTLVERVKPNVSRAGKWRGEKLTSLAAPNTT